MKTATISLRSKPTAPRDLGVGKGIPLDESAMRALVEAPPLGEPMMQGQGTAEVSQESPSTTEGTDAVPPSTTKPPSPPHISLVPSPAPAASPASPPTAAAASAAASEEDRARRVGRQQKDTPLRRADLGEDQLLRRLQVSLSAEVEEGLRVLAAKDRSSLSSLIENEMRAMLVRRGMLAAGTSTSSSAT